MSNYWSLPVVEPTYTCEEIAKSWELWQEYVDPGANQTHQEFEEMTLEERISFMEECFGPEENSEESGQA